MLLLCLLIGYYIFSDYRGKFEEHPAGVYSVAENNGIIASSSNNQIYIWDDQRVIEKLSNKDKAIKYLSFSHDNKLLVSGSTNGKLKVWDIENNYKSTMLPALSEKGIYKVLFSCSNRYIINSSYDHKIKIWDRKKAKVLKVLNVKNLNFDINKDDLLAYNDSKGNLQLFDLKSFTSAGTIENYQGVPVFHPSQNQILLLNREINILNYKNGRLLHQFRPPNEKSLNQISNIVFSPDGENIIYSIWGGDIKVLKWKKNKIDKILRGHILNSVNQLVIKNDKLISAAGDRSVKIWNWKEEKLIYSLGDGKIRKKLNSYLSFLILTILIYSFLVLLISPNHKYSSNNISIILIAWSLGLLIYLNHYKSQVYKHLNVPMWTSTVIGCIFILSMYGIFYSLITIPVALSCAYIKIKTDKEDYKNIIVVALNLIYCFIVCITIANIF